MTLLDAREYVNDAFRKLVCNKAFCDKTYSGIEFATALKVFCTMWESAIYNPNRTDMFVKQSVKWLESWCPNFLKEIDRIVRTNSSFRFVQALDGILDRTYMFIYTPREEELERIFSHSWSVRDNYAYETIWVTSTMLGIESRKLPRYIPMDLTDFPRPRELVRLKRRQKDAITREMLRHIKEIWKIRDVAISKGLVVDKRVRR